MKMVKTKIGLKTRDIFYKDSKKIDMKVLEIISNDKNFGFRKENLDKIKQELKGKDLSMHTQTNMVFTYREKTLQEMEMSILKTEIFACKYLGCKELIVHLKQDKLTTQEIKFFSEVLKISKKNKIEIIYEVNENFNGKNFLYNLEKFPQLKVNMDLCHLAMAVKNKTLNMDLDEFLRKIKKRIIYIHASGYNGKEGHLGLNKSEFDWKNVLNKLDLNKIKKIIIELHKLDDFRETKKQIEKYLKSLNERSKQEK